MSALVDAGATYFSEEYVVLDVEGRVLPFPRRPALRHGPFDPTGRLDLLRHSPVQDELVHPVPIGGVYIPRYQQDCDLRPDTLPPRSAIVEFCQHMPTIQRRPQHVLVTIYMIAYASP